MHNIIMKLLEQETLTLILEILTIVLYLTGRITKKQFETEQLKSAGNIQPSKAKETAVDLVTKPVTIVFDLLNEVPIINSKLPFLNVSVPDIGKSIVQYPIGILNDVLHNFPIFGTNVNK